MSKDRRILFLVTQNSSRLSYVLNIFFQKLLNLKVETTHSITDFNTAACPKINYSYQVFTNKGITIQPSSLLFENNISTSSIHFNLSIETTIVGTQHVLSFDVLAASFYLLSRYEEYLPFKADEHGRFRACQSMAFQQGFLKRPIINSWSLEVKKILERLFPTINMSTPTYFPIITYDIDIAWAFINRSVYRTIGATFKNLALNFSTFKRRIKTYLHIQKDPFDTFEYILNQQKKNNLPAHFFFLLGQYGKYDKNIRPDSKALHDLIKTIHREHNIGIHPSYGSNRSEDQLTLEYQTLVNITGSKITKSRQHYLKLTFPDTYRRLIELGIEEDYTMGYADAVGFRASIATPFPWFDLEKNEATHLMIYPFQVMDVTLKNYLKLNPDEARELIQEIILVCKEVGGCFSAIWHNSSLSTLDGWDKWISVYEDTLGSSK